MDKEKISRDVREYALELGFDAVGFTTAEDFDPKILLERKDKGYLSGFEEKDVEKRVSPRLILSSAKSIIALGLSYNTPYISENKKGYAFISRCAYGIDYHQVMEHMMLQLVEYIQKRYNVRSVYMVDTGPLVDRMVAHRAGIGWYGKNCSIINGQYGSWMFLGEIITELELIPDVPLKSKCGSCELCIKACPTKALVQPYVLNASKCLSYNTMKKGILPDEIKEKMGMRVYGCDTCQEVCPLNKGAKYSRGDWFIPRPPMPLIPLEDIVKMDNKRFKEIFKPTAASWRGKAVLQRNGLIAMGNTGDARYIKELEPFLDDPRPAIKDAARWALQKLRSRCYG
ncbi:tRNA epoxyqueuosine(34) reductase QueG [Caldanaerobius polysaccharolyticus]|uniref:tRNA epoxyqueuosine(34) reductase QueG n=1 Tax=Caldanaerobius polysaccharolyticus TaxID=44256 RepID=UPI00068FD0C7|nr:tRNA epoxyqueuosine(34) reductase QueG [Caldanaerobius polysaccharolyticus]